MMEELLLMIGRSRRDVLNCRLLATIMVDVVVEQTRLLLMTFLTLSLA
jgi:hypothetical protein